MDSIDDNEFTQQTLKPIKESIIANVDPRLCIQEVMDQIAFNMDKLENDELLNDVNINIYCEFYLNTMFRVNDIMEGFILPTQYMAKIYNNGKSNVIGADDKKHANYLQYRYLLFPTNIGNYHWVLVVLDQVKRIAIYHDSTNSSVGENGTQWLKEASEYIDIVRQENNYFNENGFRYTPWTFINNSNIYLSLIHI